MKFFPFYTDMFIDIVIVQVLFMQSYLGKTVSPNNSLDSGFCNLSASSSKMFSEPLMQNPQYKCLHWGWDPDYLLISTLWPSVVFCDGLHKDSLMEVGAYTYLYGEE